MEEKTITTTVEATTAINLLNANILAMCNSTSTEDKMKMFKDASSLLISLYKYSLKNTGCTKSSPETV